MRLALFLSIIGLSCFISIIRPFWGLLVYSWLAFMHPQNLVWAETGWRFSYYIALAMFIGCLFNFKREIRIVKAREIYLLILMWFTWLVSFIFALSQEVALPRMIEFSKVVLIALTIIALTRTQKKLRYLLLAIILSMGFLGVKGAMRAVFFGWKVTGPTYSMMADNNDFALGLIMVLPWFVYMGLSEKKLINKLFFILQFPLIIIAIIYTHSRGGFIGLCAVILTLAFNAKKKILALFALGIAVLSFFIWAPQEYKERIQTIKTYEEDASAMSRIYAWRAALSMIKDRPLTGVGPGKESFRYATPIYAFYSGGAAVAHNSYLELAADSGIPAILLFLLLLFSCIWKLRKLRKHIPLKEGTKWVHNYSYMLEAGFVGYLVSGFFLSRADFELLYYFIAITVVLDYIARKNSL